MLIKKLNLILLILLFAMTSCPCFPVAENYPKVADVEKVLFGETSPSNKIIDRLSVIEKNIFGKTYINDSLDERVSRIQANVFGDHNLENANVADDNVGNETPDSYENLQTVAVTYEDFAQMFLDFLNLERGFKGTPSLTVDDVATNVANEQINELFMLGYLSYSNSKNQFPDERYTIAGGTGAIYEVVKGFDNDKKGKKIIFTELLAKQLVDAFKSNSDDKQIVYNPHVNSIGYSFGISKDKTKFVSVIEFLTKGGSFEPIKSEITFGEKLHVKGKVSSPYKFKAISLGFLNDSEDDYLNEEIGFNSDNVKPYFPPQDFIAYGNTGKSTLMKVVKGIGVIGAIGAAPFTGGATAILAPVLISSFQNGPAKEIPLKSGIKVNKMGEFFGDVELNYQGMTGLYYISVLGELSGVPYPIVISRRVVKVKYATQT